MAEGKGLRAVVIGAGIGGLSCAIALRRAGAEVSLHEKQSELREVGSGLTLWVNAMRVLGQLEVADAIRERGAVVDRIDNYTAAGKRISGLAISKVADKHGAPSVSIHRGSLQQGLAEQLPEGTLRLSSECTGFEQDGDGVTVRFADGSEERADLLVGADGIRSQVRAQLVGEREPRYSGYTCWRSAAQLDHPLLERRIYIQLYGSRSTFGIFPIGEGWSWYGTKFADRDQGGADGASWKREARQAFAGWYEPVLAVIDATPDQAFVRQDIYDREPIDNWISGRVALLGDAAHATTPTLGQGGCLAIEDAGVMGRAVAQQADVPAALRRYQAERIERANGIVRQAWRHGKLYHGVNPLVRTFRDLVFLRAPQSIALREVDKLMGYEA
jgi:2-polyprenyl-6-methoxyphenol hydroxylase-like FAD-dependent oxidoreductase